MPPRVIWRFGDGKAGHENQSQGLVEALSRRHPIDSWRLNPLSVGRALAAFLFNEPPKAWRDLPAPDLIIGAGHRTHLSLLAARRCRGGKVVVLMQPSLPLCWFDLCFIPEHDAPPVRSNVVPTRGALNRIQPSAMQDTQQGLILIGGPSAHFGWDNADVYRQIAALVAATPDTRWTLTTSRRTPATFLADFQLPAEGALTLVPVIATGPEWLPAQLAQAAQVWVTADSVSMVYEALTAGAAVGILDVPLKQPNRILRGLDDLAAQGWVTSFAQWQHTLRLSRPAQAFAEAERCARWIHQQWFA